MITFTWTLAAGAVGEVPTVLTPDQVAGLNAYRDLAVDAEGDIYLDDTGDLAGVSGAEGVASDLMSRLETFLGEYMWNTAIGMPWRQEILGERPTKARIEELIRAQAMGTPGVTAVDQFALEGEGRTLSIAFRAVTDLGQVITASLLAEQEEES